MQNGITTQLSSLPIPIIIGIPLGNELSGSVAINRRHLLKLDYPGLHCISHSSRNDRSLAGLASNPHSHRKWECAFSTAVAI